MFLCCVMEDIIVKGKFKVGGGKIYFVLRWKRGN